MNMHVRLDNPWQWWQDALNGQRGELTRGDPKTGYYRDRSRAVAIWRDDVDGHLCCYVSSGFLPRNDDEIDDLFGSCSMHPISIEVYDAFVATGRWPEDPTVEIEAARAVQQSPADDASTDKLVIAQTQAVLAGFEQWLKEIGGQVASEEHDAKADKFQKALLELMRQSKEGFEAEKAEIRKKGQEIDARWRVPRAEIDAAKERMSAVVTPYRVERKRKQEEADRLAREELAKQRAEAAAKNEAPLPPVQTPRKAPSGLRQVKTAVITDLKALLAYLLTNNAAVGEIEDAVRPIARRLLEAGAQVPGAEIQISHRG